jgi:hypothetical protein
VTTLVQPALADWPAAADAEPVDELARSCARVLIAVVTCGLILLACGSTPIPSPTAASEALIVDCLGGLEQATCDEVLPVALLVVGSSGWTPVHVWLNSGLLAPMVEQLFDPSANFPYPMPPDGGEWVANAEIAFAETTKHAGIHIASVGDRLHAVLIGYAVPALNWCSGQCPTSTTTDGPFKLELVMPHLDWRRTDPMSGTAILSVDGSTPTELSGSSTLIAFSYAEVDGTRHVDPVWTADCAPHMLDPATPITQSLSKTGAIDSEFAREFLAGPDVKLPIGSWDITAIAEFFDGVGCIGGDPEHVLKATARVMVTE